MEETEKKSNESYVFLYKLINFVEYIEDNEFWNAQVVQINVLPPPNARTQPEIELIPRVGDHVILLGWLDGYERKLDKLLAFYRKAMPKEAGTNGTTSTSNTTARWYAANGKPPCAAGMITGEQRHGRFFAKGKITCRRKTRTT